MTSLQHVPPFAREAVKIQFFVTFLLTVILRPDLLNTGRRVAWFAPPQGVGRSCVVAVCIRNKFDLTGALVGQRATKSGSSALE